MKLSAQGVTVRTPRAEFHLTPAGQVIGTLLYKNDLLTLEDAKSPGAAQILTIAKKEYARVVLSTEDASIHDTTGKLGLGKRVDVTGSIPGTELRETLTLEAYSTFPNLLLLSLRLQNMGKNAVPLEKVILQRHSFASPSTQGEKRLWTFEGSSLKWGKDEIFPVPAKFAQENPFGAPVRVKDDLGHVGGGIPVVAFWSHDVGEAVGHIEALPLVISVPVETTSERKVEVGVSIPARARLKPGDVYATPRTFLAVYSGDFYEPLKMWSDAIEKESSERPANHDENYAVAWCGWGYEFGVTPKQMLGTIPKLKELGIHWATLDDGWFNDYGDWQPRESTFGGGAILDMVKQFHDQGIKLQLWWLPWEWRTEASGMAGANS